MTMIAPMNVAAEEALRERVLREKARRHLVDFSEYMNPWYRAAAHHRLIGEYLELVETYVRTKGETEIGRLLILAPPRHGKSEQVSRHFPAWMLGRLPDTRVILASYGADLAMKHSRAARDLVQSGKYRAVFGDLAGPSTVPSTALRSAQGEERTAPVEISDESRSVVSWDLAAPHRGGMMAAGVGGAITGMGANLLIVDDPVKNRQEAESEDQRERVWEWWTSTAYTRLEDGAAVVGMLTRWHADDWGGRILKAMATDPKADRWTVLALPAIFRPSGLTTETQSAQSFPEFQREKMLDGVWVDREDPLGRQAGQALWPAKYNEEDLERIEVNVGQYDFSALYQQEPYSRSGGFFKREWFTVVERGPEPEQIIARIRYWDKAGTKTGQGGDFAAGVLMSMTKDETIWVEHMARGQFTPGQREDFIVRTARLDAERKGPRTIIWHQQDPASAGLDSAQATNRRLAKEGFTARFEIPSGDKEVRAGPWSSALEGGQARLVRGAWIEAYIEEHVSFPKAKYDDQVDVSASGFSRLAGRKAQRKAESYQG